MVSHDSLGNNDRTPNNLSDNSGVYDMSSTAQTDDSTLQSFRYRTFACPHCHTLISVTRADVGKKVLCPDCELDVPVPNYLDFEHPTEYELQYYDEQKRKRDKLLSPLTNPNREGLDVHSSDLYSIRGESQIGTQPCDRVEYYPVRCRVCETLMQATRDMLGKTITCPDCGAETIVTDSLKRQQEAVKVSFQPRERGAYEIGEIPEAPMIAMQRMDGKTVMIDPKKKTIAPSVKPSTSRKRVGASVSDSFDDLSFTHENGGSSRLKKGRLSCWLEKRAKRRERKLEAEEDLTQYLPPMVLRRKNGELVWSQPSPPRPAPLFNKTFQATRSEEIWARAGALFLGFLGLSSLDYFVLRPDRALALTNPGTMTAAFSELEMLFSICIMLILAIVTSAFSGLFFWSVYHGGNSGARKIVEWRNEDIFGFFLYGLWFLSFVLCCCLPGILINAVLDRICEAAVATSIPLIGDFRLGVILTVSLWFFFPIFWTSTHQTDLIFCPITTSVFTSFFSKFHVWLEFYLFSIVLFLAPIFFLLLVFKTSFYVVFTPVVLPLVEILYGLLLGRLSWILDDEIRLMDFDDE